MLELPEKIAAAKGIHLIVCIDEFQQLALPTRLQKYGGKNALCLAEAATSLLLLLRKQTAYDDGHLQQFF